MAAKLASARKGESFGNRLRKQLALPPVASALLQEADREAARLPTDRLAALVKALPLTVTASGRSTGRSPAPAACAGANWTHI